MPKLVEIPESPRATHDGKPVDAAPVADRRKNERQIATFRTCCIVIDGEAHPAILRNMSNGGAMFEALVPAQPNTLLTYWWDGIQPVEARVAWVEGNRIGVANLSGPAAAIPVPRPRATRVPARLHVRIWQGSSPQWCELENISMSGIAVHMLDGAVAGALCTIEVGGQTLHNAMIVRSDDLVTGIRFERPLPPAKLIQMLEDGLAAEHEGTRPLVRRDTGATASGSAGQMAAPTAPAEDIDEQTDPRHSDEPPKAIRRFL
ncbi:PilZ domain-containing protein [Citromicrobium bathyomarinum]|uniref:PilZ domain-containing protein n=1 Tax=Citromicrobium bathyomarinum TaxID=72174 RepID=UPI00315A7EC4